jgi:hypothetical protein
MGLLQSTASVSNPLSMSEVVSHFGQSGTQELRSFLRGGGKVPSTKTVSTTQSAPSSNGTTNNFGGVSGLTMVRSESLGSEQSLNYTGSNNYTYTTVSGDIGDQFRAYFYGASDFGYSVRKNGSIVYQGNSSGGGAGPYSDTVSSSGIQYMLYSGGDPGQVMWTFRRLQASYVLTNNTGGSITVNGTTWSSGNRTISPSSGNFNISYSSSINAGVPSSGTLSLLDFLGADNGS